jgi:hypothetical protein
LVCIRLEIICNPFHVSVLEDEFPLINNASICPTGCLFAPVCGKLTPDQVYSPSTPVIGDRSLSKAQNRVSGGNPVSFQFPRAIDKNGKNPKGDEEASGGNY